MKALFRGPIQMALLMALAGWSSGLELQGYPLDGYETTGIRRLLAYRKIQQGLMAGNLRLAEGALRNSSDIRLQLAGVNESWDVSAKTPRDPELQAGLEKIIARRHSSYRVALVDITEPSRIRYAAMHEDQGYIPGSVGKLLVMTGLFHQLRKLFPDDPEARNRLLRDTQVQADRFVIPNSHAVPVVSADLAAVTHRSIQVGDVFSLWEWVDHMVSPSSNAAASMVWKQVMLMEVFGRAYPVSVERQEEFFRTTPKPELTELSIRVLEEPLTAAGIDTEKLRLRTFFTSTAASIIPGRSSHSTPGQLVRWLVKLEQGKLVDGWSSLEMKKLLYFTRRRYRYAASPALARSGVFFKSGSLYRCRPEPEFQCGQYRGNAENLMHSVAIVESPAPDSETNLVYLVSMMSNVLKVNSAQEHAEIATEIERLIRQVHASKQTRSPGNSGPNAAPK